MKGDCPEPPKPRGNCRHCDQEGHIARDCPEKPAELCRNCNEEGLFLIISWVMFSCTNLWGSGYLQATLPMNAKTPASLTNP